MGCIFHKQAVLGIVDDSGVLPAKTVTFLHCAFLFLAIPSETQQPVQAYLAKCTAGCCFKDDIMIMTLA